MTWTRALHRGENESRWSGLGSKWRKKQESGTLGSPFKGVASNGEHQKGSRDQFFVFEMNNGDACLLKGRTQSNGKSECAGEGKGQSPDGRVGQGQSRDAPSHGRGGRSDAGQ